MIPETVYTMLACARIGAVHSVVFGGFSAESLRDRIIDAKCRIVVTANEGLPRRQEDPLKKITDRAIEGMSLSTPCSWRGAPIPTWTWSRPRLLARRGVPQAALERAPRSGWGRKTRCSSCTPPAAPASRKACCTPPPATWSTPPSRTSWSSTTTRAHLLLRRRRRLDHGPPYIVLRAAGQRRDDGDVRVDPTYPDPGATGGWSTTWDQHLLHRADRACARSRRPATSSPSATSGPACACSDRREPINPEIWRWYHDVVGDGRCTIVDTWWQTETGGS